MRHQALVAGILFLALGATISFVPIFPVPGGSQTIGGGGGQDLEVFEVRTLLVPQYLDLQWSSSVPLTVWVIDCGSVQPAVGASPICPTNRTLATGSGMSGTLSISAENGDWVVAGTSGANASVSIRSSNGIVGVPTMAFGATIAITALLLDVRRRRSASRSEEGDRAPEDDVPGATPEKVVRRKPSRKEHDREPSEAPAGPAAEEPEGSGDQDGSETS